MAQIIKKNNALAENYKKYKKLANTGYLICGICFILFAVLAVGMRMFAVAVPLILGFAGGGMVGGLMKQRADAIGSGLEGEAATAMIISSLPESYCGFQNLKVTYDGSVSELDMVVVGPSGVFIIETKNLGGTVVGNCDNPQWVQKKIGQQGTPYSKNFYNPIKQVGTHTYRLAHFLRENGINVHVNNMVYFSNPETVVQLMGSTATPVFSALANGGSDICGHILNGEQKLPHETVQKIANLLYGIKN